MKIKLKDIEPNPNQPRKYFDATYIQELADSINAHGLLQEIVVRPQNDTGTIPKGKYEIVIGECRYRAHKLLKRNDVCCTVKKLTDEEAFELSLIENIKRNNLSPIEEANAMLKIATKQRDIASRLGISENRVSQKLSLLKLPKPLHGFFLIEPLTESHGRLLLGFVKFLDDVVHTGEKVKFITLMNMAEQAHVCRWSTGELEEKIGWFKHDIIRSSLGYDLDGIDEYEKNKVKIDKWIHQQIQKRKPFPRTFGKGNSELERRIWQRKYYENIQKYGLREKDMWDVYGTDYAIWSIRWADKHGLMSESIENEEELKLI